VNERPIWQPGLWSHELSQQPRQKRSQCLEADRLIRGDAEIDLTAEGDSLFRDLRGYVASPRAELLSEFEADDIDTTVRTLQATTRGPKASSPPAGVTLSGAASSLTKEVHPTSAPT
jgi:hypothetical protein